MLADMLRSNFYTMQQPAKMILMFFMYSYLGYLLECIVLTLEHRQLVINRGFARHLPFCVIYGFGAMIGVPLLLPFVDNLPLLFVFGAIGASLLELITARVQIYLFGDFWWDYTNKHLNYRGMLCLESTIGWGFAGIVIVKYLHQAVVYVVRLVPSDVAALLSFALILAYVVDFSFSTRVSLLEKQAAREQELVEQTESKKQSKTTG